MCVRRALTGPQAQSRPDFPIRAVFWLRLLENLLISLITVSITPAAAVRRVALPGCCRGTGVRSRLLLLFSWAMLCVPGVRARRHHHSNLLHCAPAAVHRAVLCALHQVGTRRYVPGPPVRARPTHLSDRRATRLSDNDRWRHAA